MNKRESNVKGLGKINVGMQTIVTESVSITATRKVLDYRFPFSLIILLNSIYLLICTQRHDDCNL